MKAVILAAGRGSRMNSVTDDRPKCLVHLLDRPLLDWQIGALEGAGIQEIAIVTGYRRDRLSGRGLTEFHNPRWGSTNMVSSLACASQWLEAGPCIVSYSDIVYEPSAVTALAGSRAALAITYDPNWHDLWQARFEDPLSDAETFRLNLDGTLAEIGSKPGSMDDIEGQYMGLLRVDSTGWQEIEQIRRALAPPDSDRLQMTEALERVIRAGRVPVRALPYHGLWGEIDSESDLQFTQRLIDGRPAFSFER